MNLLIQGAGNAEQIPGLEPLPAGVSAGYAPDERALKDALPDTEVLLSWDFRDKELQTLWHCAANLKWVHWCGAGVDAALFDGMASSNVILTNARGIFDRAMAETVLGYMIAEAKDFETTREHQRQRVWEYRQTRQLKGDSALVVGVGSIGREIARMLKAMGLSVSGAGRSERRLDPDFDMIYASSDIRGVLRDFDWVIGIMPSTEATTGFFNADFFSAMSRSARFVNIGRGTAVVEEDLVRALEQELIAGAMLDVFTTEPLDQDDPMWSAPNLFVSPHISGDYCGFERDLVELFKMNLQRYLAGEQLYNLVDKKLGFVNSN